MEQILSMITGVEVVVVAGASALIGSIFGRYSKRGRRRKLPEKQIEITVQRIDRPCRKRR